MASLKTWKSKNPTGKSVVFLWLVMIGYVSGATHKICYNYDWVLWLYLLNLAMVAIDTVLVYKYKK